MYHLKKKKINVPILRYNKNYDQLDRKKLNQTLKCKMFIWTDSKIELFFLQIQGSGIGSLEKKKIKINYGEIIKKIFIYWKILKKKNSSMEKLIYLQ